MKFKLIFGVSIFLILFIVGCSTEIVQDDNTTEIITNNNTIIENTTILITADPLESFFLITYTEPIFFTPEDYIGQINLGQYEDFTTQKVFQDYQKLTGEKLDVYPNEFLQEYDVTQRQTILFYADPTLENAEALIAQQRKTLLAYTLNLGDLIKVFNNKYNYTFVTRYNRNFDRNMFLGVLSDFNDNTLKVKDEIDRRERILQGKESYSLSVIKKPELKEFEVFAPNDIISKDVASDIISVILYKMNNISKTYIAEDLSLYKINLKCWSQDSAYVYGVNDNGAYPSIFNAEEDMIIIDYTCPYSDVETLNWIAIDDILNKINKDPILKLEEYEMYFVNNPTQNNLELLSKVYRAQLYDDLRNKNMKDVNALWIRTNQIDSKVNLYDDVYGYINFSQYYDIFVDDNIESYIQVILPNSFLFMTFMPWSSSVWFDETPMDFDVTNII